MKALALQEYLYQLMERTPMRPSLPFRAIQTLAAVNSPLPGYQIKHNDHYQYNKDRVHDIFLLS